MKRFARRHQRRHGPRNPGESREGVIQHHGRFAFLLTETEGQSDVFLRGPGLELAMDGDRVAARVWKEAGGRSVGEIERVLKRGRSFITGLLQRRQHGWMLVPEKGGTPPAQVTSFAPGLHAAEDMLAVLQVTRWPSATEGAAGRVTEILGHTDDVRARITMLVRERGFKAEFPREALAQSEALPDRLSPEHWRGREELFHLPIVTIDGIDAKDFDDAISVERLPGGALQLGVHIADVSHYVKPGTALDQEAYARATSVYLPDRVLPMLPPSLSNNLCSLVPYEERLTMSVFMDIAADGKVTKRRLAETVIRSCRRLTYEDAQILLDGGTVPAVPKGVVESMALMGELARVLRRHRFARGSLDFDLPEYKVVTDANGRPLRVELRARLESHRLIEEFMLLANEAIATELIAARIPFLHRRHDEPDPVKIKTLAVTLGEMGLSAGRLLGGDIRGALQDVLKQAAKHPLADIINSLIVRSMKQAVYSPESSGHFGIAARAYAHFTSPIRRYPDLMAHRAVRALLAGKREAHAGLPLDVAGAHCSERERAAAEAEYKAIDIMRADLFKGMVGEVMEGTVTTVMERGVFVMLGETGTEGMLRFARLRPGDRVKVVVETVDVAEGKIGLTLAEQPRMPAQVRMTADRRKEKHSHKRHRR